MWEYDLIYIIRKLYVLAQTANATKTSNSNVSSILWYNLMILDTLSNQLSCNTHRKICGLIHSDNARISTKIWLVWFLKVNTIQYRVCPLADWITAQQRRLIERKYCRITFIGMLFHFCTNACWSLRSWIRCWRTRLSSRPHTCSIGGVWRFRWQFHNIHVVL